MAEVHRRPALDSYYSQHILRQPVLKLGVHMLDETGHLGYTAKLRKAMVHEHSADREGVQAKGGDIVVLRVEE